jgi:uncharacterized membrane protein YphA (DoxX/SURF4 family)
MYDKRALNFYSVIIGVFFIISGIGKLIDTSAFSDLLYQYGFGPLKILSPLIVVIEILLGLLLILLVNPKRYSLFSFVLLLIFSIGFAYAHFAHGVNNCGCFGTLQPANISPMFSFVRNFILLCMSLVVWIKYPDEQREVSQWKKPLIVGVLGISAFISGLTFKKAAFLRADPGPAGFDYRNKNIKNTELSKLIKTSSDSTYLIFCFSYTCPHCWNSIENLREYKKSNTVDHIVAFAVGADSSKLFFVRNFHPDFSISDLPINTMLKLTNLFPAAFYVKHDSIKAVIQGELPSPVTFKNQYNISDSE